MELENYRVRKINRFPVCGFAGRRRIETAVQKITRDNVVAVLNASLATHAKNASEIEYLYGYYRGIQYIQYKVKLVRESINNKVVVNRANEIVTFKTAYLLNAPIQYISYGGEEKVSDAVNRLNEYMRAEDKDTKDKEIIDWMHICGVGVRLTLDDKDYGDGKVDGAPFRIFTLDPREAYVIYSSGIGKERLAGVILQQDEDGKTYADVYTKDMHYVIKGGAVVAEFQSMYGDVPLVEYLNNNARLGAFESVISLLNSINALESDAVDNVNDCVNGFDVFQNCDIADGDYSTLSIGGKAVKIKSTAPGVEAKVYRVFSEMSQTGLQTRIDDMTDAYLTICGMPNRNGGLSTSDTGTATIFRDGWAEAESRAKDSENLFSKSERETLRIVLRICEIQDSGKNDLGLKVSDIKTEFLRKNLANLQSKTQVLCELLNNNWVHPKLAFEAASLFKDNEEAFRISAEYHDERVREQEEQLKLDLDNARKAAQGNV